MQHFLRAAVLVSAALSALSAQTPRPASLDRENALRGQVISISLFAKTDAPDPKTAVVWLDKYKVKPSALDDKSATFEISADETGHPIELGAYQVYLQLGARTLYAGKLNVVASLAEVPRKIEVAPAIAEIGVSWKDLTAGGRANWRIFGEGFANDTPQDIKLLVNRSEQAVVWLDPDAIRTSGAKGVCSVIPSAVSEKTVKWPLGIKTYDANAAYGIARSSSELDICNVPVAAQGPVALAIRQGSAETPAVSVQATKWTRRLVLGLSTVVTVLIAALVWYLLSFKGPHRVKDKVFKYTALLLDKQTNTYSLSKAQFLLWTLAALFGYAYLALSKLFVQRLDTIPEVPDVLPGIVGIGLSAATAIASQAIAQIVPKGAGEELPSPSDLVTSGGSVAPDRIQMLVWTLIGVGVFLAGVLKMHPATIDGLPAIPNSLMALMGLSSAGYLGAKFARKPGPNILELTVTPASADTGAAPLATAQPADVAQPVAQASQALAKVKAAAAGAPDSSAPVAAKQVRDAQTALEQGIASAATLTADNRTKLSQLASSSRDLAMQSAFDFERAAGAAGSEPARVAASATQIASAALEDLSSAVEEAISKAQEAQALGAEQRKKDLRRVIEIRGQNLSPEALFRAKVGDGDEFDIPSRMLEMKDNKRQPEVVVRDESNPSFARTLRLDIVPSQLEPVDRAIYDRIFGQRQAGAKPVDITFSIFNPDGQKAVKTFALPPGEAQRQ